MGVSSFGVVEVDGPVGGVGIVAGVVSVVELGYVAAEMVEV